MQYLFRTFFILLVLLRSQDSTPESPPFVLITTWWRTFGYGRLTGPRSVVLQSKWSENTKQWIKIWQERPGLLWLDKQMNGIPVSWLEHNSPFQMASENMWTTLPMEWPSFPVTSQVAHEAMARRQLNCLLPWPMLSEREVPSSSTSSLHCNSDITV